MIRYHHDVEQRSEEWYALRLGMVTASAISTLIAVRPADPTAVDCPRCGVLAGDLCVSVASKARPPIKTAHEQRAAEALTLPPIYVPATGDTAKAFMHALVAERVNGWADEPFMSSDMLRGQMDEPIARDHYSENVAPVTECGYITRDDWGFAIGYSPDGLVGDDGLLEIKSRRPKAHLRTVLADSVPAENMAQCQTALLVSGRTWLDYVSWASGMPMWVIRVFPDHDWQNAIVAAARAFEETATEMLRTYRERVAGLPTTERQNYNAEVEV